jgi:hypothetical protein
MMSTTIVSPSTTRSTMAFASPCSWSGTVATEAPPARVGAAGGSEQRQRSHGQKTTHDASVVACALNGDVRQRRRVEGGLLDRRSCELGELGCGFGGGLGLFFSMERRTARALATPCSP